MHTVEVVVMVIGWFIAGFITLKIDARMAGPDAKVDFEHGSLLITWPVWWLYLIAFCITPVIFAMIVSHPRNYLGIIRSEFASMLPSENQKGGLPEGFPFC